MFNSGIDINWNSLCIAIKCEYLISIIVYVTSKVVKKNWEQDIHGWYEGSNIYWSLFDLWWDSNDKQRLWEWDMIICLCIVSILEDLSYVMNIDYQKKQARNTWMRQEFMHICSLKLESLHIKLNYGFKLINKILCMT